MKKFSELKEARGDTAVFTFGRFNPPTTGHELLLNKVAAVAKQNAGAPYYIFASHSENPKKDPLPYTKKVAYMKKMFRKHARNIVVDKARNVFEIAVSLHNKGHKAIVMVVGSDRVSEFESLLNKYNGVEARHGYYGFDNIEIVSAGERDPDAEGVSGMSASKMRAAASANDFDQFKLGLPKGFNQGMSLFKDVRKFMGIRESFIVHQVQQTEEDVIRDMYLENKIFTIGEEVTDTYTGVTGKIIRRGTNYVTFATEDGTTYKKWLYELELAEDCWPGFKQVGMKKKNGKDVPNCVPVDEKQDKDIKDREGTQPAKYYAKDAEGDKMAKSTKQARARHFEKGAEKDDDDDSAYKPAPGDKSAKTKPSQHTNKMKKKFPDLYKEMKENADKSLAKKAEASGISVSILKQVYKRGVAAWRTGHRPGTTPEQWGHARVNSFITGGKTRTTADADLWKQHKGKSEEKEDPREIGTDARRERTQDMTPGQKVVKFTEHTNCGTPSCCNECETSSLIESNVYRVGSEKYYEFFQEKRDEYKIGVYNPVGFDKELMEGDLGKFDMYQGQHVPLDCPMIEEKDVELNKPKVGGPKKYYVYVKDPSTGNVKKVTWGDTTGLKVKLNDKEARKSFAARHDCENAKDRTKASYWACNLPRYAKQLGLSGGGNFFW
jgi:phosphopantetheine adenylyltransferase